MKQFNYIATLLVSLSACAGTDKASLTYETQATIAVPELAPSEQTPGYADSFAITDARVSYIPGLELLIFEQDVEGAAATFAPTPAGGIDGAPVLGYVFPTSLKPSAVGFGEVEGTLALALTSHPDFDDTPLWDESQDQDYANDGIVYHSHWVVLVSDDRAPAGLAVKQALGDDTLPPTAPMPMYLDSPGFTVLRSGNTVRVVVPVSRVGGNTNFNYDAVTALMRVDASGEVPLLKVESVYSNLSGDLSAPFAVEEVHLGAM
ncbi:MAG: hypothetical protein JKY56_04490 [Kofleriaceae bacterium]|nr:hypothetical protein [Kofleriaceae bacterium]